MFDMKTEVPEDQSKAQHLLNMADDLKSAAGATMFKDVDDRAPRNEAIWADWHKDMVEEALRFAAQHIK